MPVVGTADSTRQAVDDFYNFWYEFESWREYSYLDEEDKDKGQDRDERRWIEKQNRTIRIKRKKEEMSRIRQLVDLAYNNDPRIVKFRNEDKERKQAAKRAKMNVAQAARAEEERVLREAQALKKEAEAAEQKRIEQIRLEKEQQKRALKKERKQLRDKAKEAGYYSTSDKEKVRNMEGVEKICEMLKFLELQEFNKSLAEGGRDVFLAQLKTTEEQLEAERKALFEPTPAAAAAAAAKPTTSAVADDRNALWTPENMQLLIKAVNLYPAGTVQRWEVTANYMNQHATNLGNKKFMAREVLNKAKNLQNSDFAKNMLKEQANEEAFASFQKSKKDLKIIDPTDISVNTDAADAAAAAATAEQSAKVTTNGTPAPANKIVENGEATAAAAATVNNKKDKKPSAKPRENGVSSQTSNNPNSNNNNPASSNSNAKNSKKNKSANNNNGLPETTNAATANAAVVAVNGTAAATADDAITQNGDTTAAAEPQCNGEKGDAAASTASTTPGAWTKEEQVRLEAAIKMFPLTTVDRWERIAECVPNKTKKDCLRRVKELVNLVSAKRDAHVRK